MKLGPRRRRRLERLLTELRWRRYARDPRAFFAECIQVPDESNRNGTGRVPLELYDYQDDTLDLFMSERFLAVLKARQLGLTTIAMAYALWLLLFHPGTNVLLVSKDQPTADTALELLDFMWRFLPASIRDRAPELVNDSARQHTWQFADGMKSTIRSLPATKTVGAGGTARLVIWDEAGLAKFQDETFSTLESTTDAGGSMIIFSTARGAHNKFAGLCRDARAGRSQYKFLFHSWVVSRLINPKAHLVRGCQTCGGTGKAGGGWCPTCVDPTQYEAKKRSKRDRPWEFFSEYPFDPDEAFRQSGRSRFDHLPPLEEFEPFPLRGRLEHDGAGGYRFVEDEGGALRLRADARNGAPRWARSVLSLDGASGVGGDYIAMTGGWIDQEGIPQRVAFWHDNEIEPLEASRQADMLGRFLGGSDDAALIVVERQGGYGDTFVHELRTNLLYPRLYRHRYTGHRKHRREETFGMPMTPTRRPLVIDRLAQWLLFDGEHDVLEGIDPLLRHELGAFVVKDNGRVEADVGMHDDLVMSCAIWLYVLTEEVGGATAEPKGEEPSDVQTFDLSAMWAEVEKARAEESQHTLRAQREFERSMTRRRR